MRPSLRPSNNRAPAWIWLVLGVLAAPGAARAQEPEPPAADGARLETGAPPPAAKAAELPPPSAPPGVTRPLPDYRERPGPRATAGEVLIWIPRAILAPVHLVLQYLVRVPVVKLAAWGEEYRVYDWVKHVFIWEEGRVGLYPSLKYELGFRPYVGGHFFLEAPWFPDNELVLTGGSWFNSWWRVGLEDRLHLFADDSALLVLRGGYTSRGDHAFYGVGSDSRHADETFFRMNEGQAQAELTARLAGLNRVGFSAAYRHATFGPGRSPSIQTRFDLADPAVVPGFGGYSLVELLFQLELDTRSPRVERTSGTGLRLEWNTAYAVDPADSALQFVRWGGQAFAFLDLTGSRHVLALRLFSEFVEQLGDRPVPLTELVTLGRYELMHGYWDGRFRGQSGFVLSLEYQYPIWAYLDANLFLSAGNTFDGHLKGLSFERLYLSWGLALRSSRYRDTSIDLIVAFGSNRLDAPEFDVDSFHFVLGINEDF